MRCIIPNVEGLGYILVMLVDCSIMNHIYQCPREGNDGWMKTMKIYNTVIGRQRSIDNAILLEIPFIINHHFLLSFLEPSVTGSRGENERQTRVNKPQIHVTWALIKTFTLPEWMNWTLDHPQCSFF